MIHLEMSYLTHSKFSTTMTPNILPLFRARFRIFWWILYFEFSSARDLVLLFPSFAQGFGFFNKLILCPSICARFRVFSKNDTSILFHLRFEADLWYFYPPSPEVRNWSLFTDTSILFCPRFWIFHKLILCPSVRARFRVLLKNDTSILFSRVSKLISDTYILLHPRFWIFHK